MTAGEEHFEKMYAANSDPWQTASRWYERRKCALLLAALPRERYASAFEPACGIGVLTEALAVRCDRLLASDSSPTAVQLAQRRLAPVEHVLVQRQSIPREWPAGTFELIVISEMAYYLDADDLAQLCVRIAASLSPQGTLVACHWRHPTVDRKQATGAAHAALGAGLFAIARHEEPDFLLDLWSGDPRSVGAMEGLS